jgi:hypothetical protein
LAIPPYSSFPPSCAWAYLALLSHADMPDVSPPLFYSPGATCSACVVSPLPPLDWLCV